MIYDFNLSPDNEWLKGISPFVKVSNSNDPLYKSVFPEFCGKYVYIYFVRKVTYRDETEEAFETVSSKAQVYVPELNIAYTTSDHGEVNDDDNKGNKYKAMEWADAGVILEVRNGLRIEKSIMLVDDDATLTHFWLQRPIFTRDDYEMMHNVQQIDDIEYYSVFEDIEKTIAEWKEANTSKEAKIENSQQTEKGTNEKAEKVVFFFSPDDRDITISKDAIYNGKRLVMKQYRDNVLRKFKITTESGEFIYETEWRPFKPALREAEVALKLKGDISFEYE